MTNEQKLSELNHLCTNYPKNYLTSIEKHTQLGKFSDGSLIENWIEEMTHAMCQACNFEYSLKTRIWWILNSVETWENPLVKCANCGKPLYRLNVKNVTEGYNRKTCCKECERKKAQQSNEQQLILRYGVKNAFQLPEVVAGFNARKEERQAKRDATRIKHFGDMLGWNLQKSIQTRRERYGCAWNQKEVQKTKITLYGDPNWNNPAKNFKTKRKNGTLNSSKPEDQTYRLLCRRFGKDDVIRQHKSKEYPFACDFYITSKDLYVECNYGWTHGGHFFDMQNQDDIAKLELWKSKGTDYYLNAIKTWTHYDVHKLETAKMNNLNYIVWWNLEEATEAIQKL